MDRQPPLEPQNEEAFAGDSASTRPGLIMVLLTLLLVLAMLATLVWPLLRTGPRRQPTPTPTPLYLEQA